MLTKGSGVALVSVIVVIYRLYLIFSLTHTEIESCHRKFTDTNSVANTTAIYSDYGPCVDGKQKFYNSEGHYNGVAKACEVSNTGFLDMTECVSKNTNGSSSEVTAHIGMMFLQGAAYVSIGTPFSIFMTILNVIFRVGGDLLNPKSFITLCGTVFIIGELFGIAPLMKMGGKTRGPNGRFIKE